MGTGEIKDDFSICSICIMKCHEDHDLKYVTFGQHYCHCGQRGEESCQALKSKGNYIQPQIFL